MSYKLHFCGALLAALFIFSLVGSASADSFTANSIIDDALFNNTQTMSANQINSWLNSNFGSTSCISTDHGFSAPDPTGYTPSGGFTYGGNVSAGQVIADASQAYSINPQVLLTTLQKEQTLVSGAAGCSTLRYTGAAGYGCPDGGTTYNYSGLDLYTINGVSTTSVTGTCVNSAQKAGFSQQVIHAAWLLKFGEERSEGNINWDVQLTNAPQPGDNWDNSDDPQSCYGGPMTQGTWQICPSGATTFYDGYTTIDGTAVHMDDGATAALYWYTPHFPGNENFFNIFTGWFGSTHYLEPAGGLVELGNQSGKLYFVSLDNSTRYYIPTWSTLQAFGLDRYQIIPTDDTTIDSYTDGGTLKTLVFDNNDQKVYLVDNGKRYWFQLYCSQWGLDCTNQTTGDVSFLTSTYFDNFVTYGGLSQPIQQVNGTYYLMQNGTKEPFASLADMQTMGYTTSQSMPIVQTDLNSTQPLGDLQIANPTFIQFSGSPSLFYFDGQNFHHVPSYDVYTAWGYQPIMTPPISAYNTAPPTSSSTLSIWVEDSNNNDYLVDSGRKINITSNPTTWFSGSFQSFSNAALAPLSTAPEQTNVSSGGAIYVVQNATERHVPTYDDYVWLGINPSNTLALDAASASGIPSGTDILRDGSFFTVTNNPGLYATNASSSFHIPSIAMANDFAIDWSNIKLNLGPAVLSQAYPSVGDLTRWVKSGGNLSYVTNKTLVTVSPTAAANWGISLSSQPASTVNSALLFNLRGTQPLGQFVRDETTGGVYYGSGGSYHYIASYATFIALGGLKTPPTDVYPDFFSSLTQGSTEN
jgi:hypothetical protein